MAVGDIYEMRVICATSSQISVNVYHHLVTSETVTPASLQAIATAFDARVQAIYKLLMTDQATYRGVGVRKIKPLPPTLEVTATANQGPGTNTGDPLPKQIAGVISFRTSFSGVRYRGRKYIPFPAEGSSTTSAQPFPAYVTGLQGLADAVIPILTVNDGANSTTLGFAIFHRDTREADLVISAIPRAVWGTQRRRGDFGRANTPPF